MALRASRDCETRNRPGAAGKRSRPNRGEPCKDRPAGVYMEPESGFKMEIPVDIKTIGRTELDSATI